jgi:HD-like signal output (HDOD) protein
MILDAWDFPPELSCVPVEYMKYGREHPDADYADLVMVANLQSADPQELGDDVPEWSEISAFERLGIPPEVNAMEVEDLSEAMQASIASLQ